MPNRTIYVKQKDDAVWECANALAKESGQSISHVITTLLKAWARQRAYTLELLHELEDKGLAERL